MAEYVELDVHSTSWQLNNDQKKAVMRRLKREFGNDVEISVDTREEGVFYNMTTAIMSSVGTVVVTNPQLVSDVIKYVYQSEHITINDILNSGSGSWVKVNVGDIDLTMINIERKIEVDDSTFVVETSTDKDAKELQELIEENK